MIKRKLILLILAVFMGSPFAQSVATKPATHPGASISPYASSASQSSGPTSVIVDSKSPAVNPMLPVHQTSDWIKKDGLRLLALLFAVIWGYQRFKKKKLKERAEQGKED